jgi:endonuclease III
MSLFMPQKRATTKSAKLKKPAPNAAAKSPAKRKKRKGAELKSHATEILARLKKEYPDAHCELDFQDPLQLLIATILSAQCTDKRVNMVTPELFRKYPDAESMSSAKPEDLEEIIKSTGFFRNKTKSLLGMSAAVAERHGGKVPSTMDELVHLPGVGRKTANVVLGNAYGINEGVVVDTHVGRLSVRLGLTDETDPVKVEQALMPLFPRDDWALLSHLLIFHGRRTCISRAPKCADCVLNDICPSARI